MRNGAAQSAAQHCEEPATSEPHTGLLPSQETVNAPDPLLELYQQAQEDELRQRQKAARRLEIRERHRAKKSGHLGELVATLEVPRRYWPAIHQCAITNAIPLRTEPLRGNTVTPIRFATSESGAARLRALVPE